MKIIMGFGFITLLDYVEDWQLRAACYIVAVVVAILFIMWQHSKDF